MTRHQSRSLNSPSASERITRLAACEPALPPELITSGTNKVSVAAIAVRKVPQSNTGVTFYNADSSVQFVLCGLGTACAKACPTGSIMFGTKQAMIDQAHDRVEDLKSRGFDKAGLYDPAGVGGTHVMYVLHHNDKPSIYAGLPDNARISPLVEIWKGAAKLAATATDTSSACATQAAAMCATSPTVILEF